jgi:hypothetical protein
MAADGTFCFCKMANGTPLDQHPENVMKRQNLRKQGTEVRGTCSLVAKEGPIELV